MSFEIGAAGVTFAGRQEKLAALHRMQVGGAKLTAALLREPDNRFDPKAVMILVGGASGEAHHIGYVPKALAARLAARMDAGQQVRAVAVRILRGGDPGAPGYGVRIDVENDESREVV